MYCSDGLIAIFWFIFMSTNFYIAGMTVIEGNCLLTALSMTVANMR
jgi:hypothetical protein